MLRLVDKLWLQCFRRVKLLAWGFCQLCFQRQLGWRQALFTCQEQPCESLYIVPVGVIRFIEQHFGELELAAGERSRRTWAEIALSRLDIYGYVFTGLIT